MSRAFDETYDVYNELFPKARKAHRCEACARPIRVGDQYAKVSIIYDGTTETVKRCLGCQTIHKHLRGMEPGELWPDERLNCGEEYEQHWGCEPPPEIARIAFMTEDELQAELRPELTPNASAAS